MEWNMNPKRTRLSLILIFALAAMLPGVILAAEPAAEAATLSEAAETAALDGMDMPLDGSSLEAFEQSLEKVKANTSEANYTTLRNAIDYLLMYDLSARRDKTKLAANLNGLTGNEVVDKVSWRKSGG
jgi:hypothetical protein